MTRRKWAAVPVPGEYPRNAHLIITSDPLRLASQRQDLMLIHLIMDGIWNFLQLDVLFRRYVGIKGGKRKHAGMSGMS
jgi:hypothetical protein